MGRITYIVLVQTLNNAQAISVEAFVVMLVACQLYESNDIIYQHHTVDVTDSVQGITFVIK